MVVSAKEAKHYIYQTEQQYEWKQIGKTALEEKLEYFINILEDYDFEEAQSERERINRKYGFNF